MRSSTGRWVSGDDFFDREAELEILESRVRGRNHVLLTGQRRMGKTSVLRELGRRLACDGWVLLFVDVEGAASPEDAVADIAQAAHPYRPIASRFAVGIRRWLSDRIEEISASQFRLKVRAGLNPGSWRRYGERLLRDCASQEEPVLLVIDEVPIFLKRMLERDESAARVDEFLSWFRGTTASPRRRILLVLIISGSIGLRNLSCERLGYPRPHQPSRLRFGWDRGAAKPAWRASNVSPRAIRVAGRRSGVAHAAYEALGLGRPSARAVTSSPGSASFATMHEAGPQSPSRT